MNRTFVQASVTGRLRVVVLKYDFVKSEGHTDEEYSSKYLIYLKLNVLKYHTGGGAR